MDLRDIKEWILDTSKYIILIIAVILIVMYVMSLQQVVGFSMEPTLKDGDVLLLSKMHYRFFDIKRNDVVAIKYDNSKYLIKRIIGLPGERVDYKNNILYINDETFEENLYENIQTKDFTFENIMSLRKKTKDLKEIPDNMYLVLGDNRGDSSDSRQIGLIEKKDIIGKTLVKIWPLNDLKLIKIKIAKEKKYE